MPPNLFQLPFECSSISRLSSAIIGFVESAIGRQAVCTQYLYGDSATWDHKPLLVPRSHLTPEYMWGENIASAVERRKKKVTNV